jgi:hypothetical protein
MMVTSTHEQADQKTLERAPVTLNRVAHVDFLRPQIVGHFLGFGAEFGLQAVGQRMRGVRADYDGPQATFGAAQGRRRRHARLSNTTFASIYNNSHDWIVPHVSPVNSSDPSHRTSNKSSRVEVKGIGSSYLT